MTAEDTEATAAAHRLKEALRNGGQLEPRTIEGVPLETGEAAYADLQAHGWRYYALDEVLYERRIFLAGGPIVMLLTGLASAIANQRARQAAELDAAPQWRPLGLLRIVVTSDRLLVWHEHAWWSVWFSDIADVRCDLANRTLDMFFVGDPPYRLVGPHTLVLGVMLTQ